MILRLAGVSKRFGAVVVADNIDLEVARGEALGIIGANGAGKSSLFNLITGVIRPDAGRVTLGDRDITATPARERCVAGLGRSFQIPRPFETLTVFENLLVAAENGRASTSRDSTALCAEILERTGLIGQANTLAGGLTLLNRKRLEMARALATEPQIVLLDEIAGGLTEQEVHEIVEIVRTLKQDRAVIWIEHIAHALMVVATRIMVLNFGENVAEGDPATVMASRLVQEIYLGIAVDDAA